MRKVLIIGHASEFQLATTMLLEKMPDVEIITHEEAERQRLTTNKAFEPEPLKFELRNTTLDYDPVVISSNKYSGEKLVTARAKRRKQNRDARKSRRQF